MPKTENFQWYVEQVAPGEIHGHALTATLAQGRSRFQTYAVVESPLFGKMLVLGGDTQSSALDEHVYHESLAHPACAAVGRPQRALILGGGEGATLRELLRVPSMRKVTMVDIDGEVVEVCRKYLPEWSAGAFENARAEVVIADAKAYVENSREHFDVIVGDLTEPLSDSPSYELHTREFYTRIRERLTPQGAYALQASTAGPHNCSLHAQMIATLRAVFPRVAPYSVYVPAFDSEWGFALCGGEAIDPLAEAAGVAADEHAKAAGLRYYDSQSHRRMFNLPRYLREAHAATTKVLR